MAESFIFEAPSDEEPELSHHEEEEEEEEEDYVDDEQEEEEEEEAASKKKPSNRHTQSPWDFASYSESVAEEHARRSTTSVDYKISRALQHRSVPITAPSADAASASDSEPDKQVAKIYLSRISCCNGHPHNINLFVLTQEDYKSEEDVDGASNADGSKSFFAPAEGASFHANSFMELNLSRPLLRACEALGYTKPTPIQVLVLLSISLSSRRFFISS